VVDGAGLAGLLDGVYSVEEVGVYKPHPKVYRLAVERLGLAPSEIAFQSSNAWDAYAASAFACGSYGATATASGPSGCPCGRMPR
jgi:2-haloacid dehalogenase